MAACSFCGASEDDRRFLVEGRGSAGLCDRCLCNLTTAMVLAKGIETPRGLSRLGGETPKMWPLERPLRRINFWQRTGQLNVPKRIAGAIARGLARFEKKRAPSQLSVYFVRPAVRPLAQLEHGCVFCGERPTRMMVGKSGGRICVPCVEHVSRTLLG